MSANDPREREEIDHEAEADKCIAYARATESSVEAQLSMIQAGVHATLALVAAQREANEQLRIANLIALGNAEHGPYRYLDAGRTKLRSEDAFGAAALLLGIGGDDE